MFVELAPNSKSPPKGPLRLSEEMPSGQVGIMLRESKRVHVDCDGFNHVNGKEVAREFHEKYRELFGEPPNNFYETPSGGIQFPFEGQSQTRKILDAEGREIGDVKASGYCVIPPSVVNGKPYRWLKQGRVQPFSEIEHLFPIPQRKVSDGNVIDEIDPVRRLIRARAWMKYREGGEDGNGRGLRMIKTCRALFAKFGLTEDQVWPLILEFNERECRPPYNEKQLRHKIEDARKQI